MSCWRSQTRYRRSQNRCRRSQNRCRRWSSCRQYLLLQRLRVPRPPTGGQLKLMLGHGIPVACKSVTVWPWISGLGGSLLSGGGMDTWDEASLWRLTGRGDSCSPFASQAFQGVCCCSATSSSLTTTVLGSWTLSCRCLYFPSDSHNRQLQCQQGCSAAVPKGPVPLELKQSGKLTNLPVVSRVTNMVLRFKCAEFPLHARSVLKHAGPVFNNQALTFSLLVFVV